MKTKDWYEMNLKFVIIGDPSVGKTSLLRRVIENKFDEQYLSTIGVDFSFKGITIRNQKVKLQIWDTAGQEKFRSLVTSYYKHTNGIIIVFNVVDKQTFFNIINNWINHIVNNVQGELPKILILGNKSDLKFNESDNLSEIEIKQRLEDHPKCRLRDIDINTPYKYNDSIESIEIKTNGGRTTFYTLFKRYVLRGKDLRKI